MTKKVTTIPALLNKQSTNQVGIVKKRRVAAYARVSTDQEEQLTSYEAQVDYYTNYIKSRDDWEFVDVYTDEGKLLGKVDDIYNTGANDIYVVKDELGKQILLPGIEEVIKEVDLDNEKIIVHLIPGLI